MYVVLAEELEEAAEAKALKIAVHDHLVIGRGGHASFKPMGLL
jgi:DNA repair protein RadC